MPVFYTEKATKVAEEFILMPRKSRKAEKSPLHFVEQPVGGARLQNAPEIRAALNPREYFTETETHTVSSLTSWVTPQFDSSALAAPPLRRGRRRRCQSAASVFDSCSELSRKPSVCKFPPLSFQTRSRGQSHQPKTTCAKKTTRSAVVPDAGNQPQGLCESTMTVSSATCSETANKQSAPIRKRITGTFSDVSHSSRLYQAELPSNQTTESHRIPAEGGSTPPSNEFSSADVSEVEPPPDVDTPKAVQEGSSCPLPPAFHLLRAQPCTPPSNQSPEILVADTPERDYGVKVTWRRRKGLMLLLKEKGLLSEPDALSTEHN